MLETGPVLLVLFEPPSRSSAFSNLEPRRRPSAKSAFG